MRGSASQAAVLYTPWSIWHHREREWERSRSPTALSPNRWWGTILSKKGCLKEEEDDQLVPLPWEYQTSLNINAINGFPLTSETCYSHLSASARHILWDGSYSNILLIRSNSSLWSSLELSW